MQTNLGEAIKQTPAGREADAILRSCIHCGFCNAACPTYRLLGDERDGPRGRIYLIKQALEGEKVGAATQLHLDRCLDCRACETICPSGVRYGRLADIGRGLIEQQVARPWRDRLRRRVLRLLLPHPGRFAALLRLAQLVRPLLPGAMGAKIPPRRPGRKWPAASHARRMLILGGCVQPAMAPSIDAAAARVLDRLGISLIRAERSGCCGALSHHLSAPAEAKAFMRRNIDAWWPHIEAGAEALVMTASGCGSMVKQYGDALIHDSRYADKAARVSALTRDIGEVLTREDLQSLACRSTEKIAFHAPCSLQHGQRLGGLVEGLLRRLGFTLTPVVDDSFCCGAAGTYSILQPTLSGRLLADKLAALTAGEPALIATANIGCLVHLQSASELPVLHWIELLDTDRERETA